MQFIRGFALFARGRSAVAAAAAAATPARRAALLGEARRIVTRFERERMPWISVEAALVAAGAENVDGDRPRTLAALRAAIDGGDAASMPLHAAAARYRLGSLVGGREGHELTRDAEAALAIRGVRCAPRFVGSYLPGQWPRAGAG